MLRSVPTTKLFSYYGAEDAEQVIIAMGSVNGYHRGDHRLHEKDYRR